MDEQRRVFLLRSAGAAIASGATGMAQAQAPMQRGAAPAQAARGRPVFHFFNAQEAALIEAMLDRLIPADESGPGAVEAGVAAFIDQQLAGAWGAGERLYRSGPWPKGGPTQGYQLPFTPAELFRTALSALAHEMQGQAPLHQRAAAEQDAFIQALQADKRDLGGVPSQVFFESLWGLCLEGFFGDPVYGGNRDAAGWRLVGFPGAYANYYHEVDRHGLRFEREPLSLADDGRGQLDPQRVHEHLGAPTPRAAPAAPRTAPARPAGGR